MVDGFPRWRMRPLQPIDIVATTPEELDRLLSEDKEP